MNKYLFLILFVLFASSACAQETEEDEFAWVYKWLNNTNWSLATKLNEKTGLAEFKIKATSEKHLKMNVNNITSYDKDVDFAWTWPSEKSWHELRDSEPRTIMAIPFAPMFSGGIAQEIKDRTLVLHKDEFISREFFIWDVYDWEPLYEFAKNKNDVPATVLSKIIEIEVEGSGEIKDFVKFRLDKETLKKMERLRKAQDKSIQKDDARAAFPENDETGTLFRSNFELDVKTGDLTISLKCIDKNQVDIDLDNLLGNMENRIIAGSKNSGTKIQSNNDSTFDEMRILVLKPNESIGKTIKLWNISIWDELCEELTRNKSQKYVLEYQHGEITGGVPIQESVKLEIDYRTMVKLEKLREAIGSDD